MEIELKLALDPRHASRLKSLPVLSGIQPLRRRLVSRYFDTPDFALTRHGIALRVRRVGGHWVQTLKGETPVVGALASRPEWETPAAGPLPDLALLPKQAHALLGRIDTRQLHAAFTTDFWRTAWVVERNGARMELALDKGEIQAGDQRLPLCEIEIERLDGPAEALFDLGLELLDHLPLRIDPRSKAARGYALAGAVTPAPVRAKAAPVERDWEAHAVWCALVGSALAQLAANIPGFLHQPEDTEYLHQLRIAARRLRVLAALAPSLDQPRPAWLPDLTEALHHLGPARDWDVLLGQRLPPLLKHLPDTPPALLEHLDQTAARCRAEAQAAVTSPAFTRVVLQAGRDLARTAAVPALDARAWSDALLNKRWKRLRAKAADLAKLSPHDRHRTRIAAKKLRYAADTLAGLYPDAKGRFSERLARLQDCLGAMQDAVMANHRLGELALPTPELAYSAGRLAGALSLNTLRDEDGCAARWLELAKVEPFWRGK